MSYVFNSYLLTRDKWSQWIHKQAATVSRNVPKWLGMSEKREYAIAAYLALCRIFRIF